MVDKLKIVIDIDAKDKQKVDALKRELLALTLKRHRVKVDVIVDKNKLKNVSKKIVKSNKDTKQVLSKTNKKFSDEEEAFYQKWKKREKQRIDIEKRNVQRKERDRKNLRRVAALGQLYDPVTDRFATRQWNEQNKQSMRPQWDKQRGGAGGGRGGGGDNRILQMPQNPLLGRMAQFGMMASGMAATMFLMQMISAQIRMLMEIMTEWEDSILKIIDSTSFTSNDMDDLSTVIRDYARTVGIANTSMAEAMGAAFQYGVDPTQANVQELYALQFSDNVKDYKEAAMIMNMAGTEFGDRAATAFTKKWDVYSGKGEESGTFGFEWEKLKGAGKDAMISVWDDDYGNRMTDSMRELSDWVSANRETIGSAFDKFVAGLTMAWKMLKVITPAATIFVGLFIAKSGMQMFIWLLKSMSGLMGPLATQTMLVSDGLATVSKGMTGATKAGVAMRGVLIGITPAVIAMVAAFAAWKLGKYVWRVYQFNKALKETETIQERLGSMSEKEKSSEKYKYESKISEARDFIQKYQAEIDRVGSGVMASEYQALINKKLEAIKKLQDGVNDIEVESAKELLKTMQSLFGEGIGSALPTAERVAGLEKINKELGYMPQLLLQIKQAQRKTTAKAGDEAMGLGPRVLINQKAQFKDILSANADFKKDYDIQMARTALSTGGMDAAEKKIFEYKKIKEMIEARQELLQEIPDKTVGGIGELEGLSAALITLDKVFKNLSTESATIKINQFESATKSLSDTIKQLDMSAYGKKIDEIQKKVTEGKLSPTEGSLLEFQEKQILNHKLMQELEKKQGKRPLDAQKFKDIANSSYEHKDTLKEVLKLEGRITSKEIAITREKAKNLTYTSSIQSGLEMQLANLKAQQAFELGHITPKELQYLKDYNKEFKDYTDRLSVIDRAIGAGKQQSTIKGYISEAEMLETIKKRHTELARAIEHDGSIRTKEQKDTIKGQLMSIITTEEQIKALESLVNMSDNYAQSAYRRMTIDERAAKLKLIEAKYSKIAKPGMAIEDRQRAIAIEKAAVDQEYFKNDITAWQEQYSIKSAMSADYYANSLQMIEDNYFQNLGLMTPANAAAVKAEEEHQLKLKNIRKESLSSDLAIGAEEALRTIGSGYQTLGQIMERSLVGAFNGISSALTSIVLGTKDAKDAFKDMARSIVTDIVSMIIKQEIFNMMVGASYASGGAMGGIFGAIGSIFSSAQGNVVSGISSYSNRVVSSPTFAAGGSKMSAYATGGALFGEAGPEAIMPLTRMPGGNLGVEASGSSAPNIEINIKNEGEPVSAAVDKQPKWDGQKWVIGIVIDSLTTNKSGFKRNMQGLLNS